MRVYKDRDVKNGYICVDFDNEGENPRDWHNLGHFITYNKRYSPDDYDDEFSEIVKRLYGSTQIDELTKKLRTIDGETYVVLPIYIYQHGYIAYSTHPFIGRAQHAEWDSGLAGIIYASKKEISEYYDEKNLTDKLIKIVHQRFEDECEIYTKYANGEVYRWDMYRFEDGVLEYMNGSGSYYDLEELENELELVDDYENFPSIETFELELYRRRNNDRLAGKI